MKGKIELKNYIIKKRGLKMLVKLNKNTSKSIY